MRLSRDLNIEVYSRIVGERLSDVRCTIEVCEKEHGAFFSHTYIESCIPLGLLPVRSWDPGFSVGSWDGIRSKGLL